MSIKEAKWIWMNGKLLPAEEAQIHVSAHALHYGTGVFEGLRCYETCDGPALFRMEAHLERLACSARTHGIVIPYTPKELGEAIADLVFCNGFMSCYVRPLCFRGSGSLRLEPESCPVEVCILAWRSNPLHGMKRTETGIRVCISEWKKFRSDMMPTTAKASGQYINSVLAVRSARDQGYDDALMLNAEGYLAEATAENIFMVNNGTLWTNDEKDSILMGITRMSVIQIASDLGYETRFSRLTVEDLLASDEAFLTGTAAEIVPISELNGRHIGKGQWPIVTQLQDAFRQIVCGHNRQYRHWLHLVKNQAGVPLRVP